MFNPPKTFSFDNFIMSIFILRNQFAVPQLVNSLIIFMFNTQNLSYLLQFRFGEYLNNSFYQLIRFILRPLECICEQSKFYEEYYFLILIAISLLENIGIIIFYFFFTKKQNYEKFINKSKNSFIFRNICYGLNVYILMAGNVLFNQFVFLSFESLKQQLYGGNTVSILLILLNFLSFALFLTIQMFYFFINETMITNRVIGIEREQISFFAICYMCMIIINPIIALFFGGKYEQQKYLLCTIQIIMQTFLIVDFYINQIYVMLFQRMALILSIAVNLSFTFSELIIESSDNKSFLECFVIIVIPIVLFQKSKCNIFERQIILNLFTNKRETKYLIFGLMKLLNKDTGFDNQDIFYKILIGQQHHINCKNQNCNYCNHLTIQNPENMCCITNKMYNDFIESQLQKYLLKTRNKNHKIESENRLLRYSFFLFDFGWTVRSSKILDYLYYFEIDGRKNILTQQIKNEVFFEKEELQDFIQNKQADNFNQQKISWFQKIKIKYIIQESKQKMRYNLFGSSLQASEQSLIQDFVNEHLMNEISIQEFEQHIKQLLTEKLKFFEIFQNVYQNNLEPFNLNSQVLQLCTHIDSTLKLLKKQMNKQLSIRVKNLLYFFSGEILQDFQMANYIKKQTTSPDKDLIKLKQIFHQNAPSQNLSYIILELCDNLQNFKILTQSQNFYQFYGRKDSTKRNFSDLLPSFLSKNHNYLVRKFFETSQSKFYYNFNLNYIINPQNLLSYIQMCYAQTNLFNNSNLTFAIYIQDTVEQNALIVIDSNSSNCIFTKNLLSLIGWDIFSVENINAEKLFVNLSMDIIYPEFYDQTQNLIDNQLKIKSVFLNLPILLKHTDEIRHPDHTFLPDNCKKELYFEKFKCDIVIEKKFIGEYFYFILYVQKISQKQQSQTKFSLIPRISKLTSIANIQLSEECQVDFENDSPRIGVLNSLNFSNIKFQSSIKINLQPIIVQLDSAQIVKNQVMINTNREETVLQSEQVGLTHRNSCALLNANSNQYLIQESQNFINSEIKDQINEPVKSKPKNDIQNIKDQFSIYENVFQKREDLIKTIQSIKQKRLLLELKITQLLFAVLFSVFIIIQYILFNTDFQSLMDNFEMETIYSSIMAPHDLFFSMQATITSYKQMNREGFINNSQLQNLTEPFYQNIGLGFEEIKNSFYENLQNKKLQHFFDDVTFKFKFMNYNDQNITSINISFQDCLKVILSYQYEYQNRISLRESTSGYPFQVSLYANFFQLHQICEELSEQIFSHSLILHQTLEKKWVIFWIIFNISFLLIFIIILIKTLKYLEKIHQLISPIYQIDEKIIHSEIKRQTELVKEFHINIYIITTYNPEDLLSQRIYRSSAQVFTSNKFTEKQTRNHKINRISIGILLFFLLIIFIFTLLSITITYQTFQKFETTSQLNMLLQDMKLRPGNMYLYREILLRWQNHEYLTQNNKEYLHSILEKGYQSIDDYITTFNNINFEQYLVDENFINFYEQINSQNFCEQIDQKFFNLTSKYCKIALEGSIQQGMISTLKYISNQIKAQQQINNFTTRLEFQLYELEGSQIISRLFFKLMNLFQINLETKFINVTTLIKLLSISYICLLVIVIGLITNGYYTYLNKIFQAAKYATNIIPVELFCLNKYFERKITELKYQLK